jgi:hypothetical protein
MNKVHPIIRSEMLKTFPDVQKFMLQNSPDDIIEQCHQGFLFYVDSWFGGYKIEKLEYIENAQFAIIEPSQDCRRPKTLRQYPYEKQTIQGRS